MCYATILFFELREVFRRYELEGDPGFFLNLLALGCLHGDFHAATALSGCILEHGCGQFALGNRGQRVRRCIDADDDDGLLGFGEQDLPRRDVGGLQAHETGPCGRTEQAL